MQELNFGHDPEICEFVMEEDRYRCMEVYVSKAMGRCEIVIEDLLIPDNKGGAYRGSIAGTLEPQVHDVEGDVYNLKVTNIDFW